MPHVVILYTGNLEPHVDMGSLCRKLADTMLAVHAEDGAQVFPTGGTRVFAYPAPHYAVSDGGTAGRAAGGDGDATLDREGGRAAGAARSAIATVSMGNGRRASSKTACPAIGIDGNGRGGRSCGGDRGF